MELRQENNNNAVSLFPARAPRLTNKKGNEWDTAKIITIDGVDVKILFNSKFGKRFYVQIGDKWYWGPAAQMNLLSQAGEYNITRKGREHKVTKAKAAKPVARDLRKLLEDEANKHSTKTNTTRILNKVYVAFQSEVEINGTDSLRLINGTKVYKLTRRSGTWVVKESEAE